MLQPMQWTPSGPDSSNTGRSGSSTCTVSSGSSASTAYPRSPEGLTFDPAVEDQPMPARLVVIGAHRVGSSSLIRRFNLGLYKDVYSPEIAKVMRHTKSLKHPQYGHYVTVQFWDVEGSDSRVALQCAYKAHAIAVIFDITNRSSFEKAQKLLDSVNPRASSVLIGNKVDLHDYRKVSYEEGRLLARIHRLEYIETSARLNYNVDEAFQILLSSVPEEYLHNVSSSATSRWRLAANTMCVICRRRVDRHVNGGGGSRPRHDSSPSDCVDEREEVYNHNHHATNLARHTSYESLRDMEDSRDRRKHAIYI